MNKKVLIRALLFILVLLISLSLTATKIVLIGDNSYPPYSYEENGKAKGVYVDVLKEIFNKIDGYEVEFKMYPWKRCIELIKNGKYIAFFPPYYADHRLAWTEFSEPILQEEVIIYGLEEKLKGKEKFPEDFYNSTFGLNLGYNPESMAGEKFASAIKLNLIKLDEAEDNIKNLTKLSRGRIDYYLNDKLIDTTEFPDVKRGPVAKINWGYLGFTRNTLEFSTYFEDFKIKFNDAVTDIKKTDEIDKIIQNYIK